MDTKENASGVRQVASSSVSSVVEFLAIAALLVVASAASRAARSPPDGRHPPAGRRSAERIGVGARDSRRADQQHPESARAAASGVRNSDRARPTRRAARSSTSCPPGATLKASADRRRRAPRVAGVSGAGAGRHPAAARREHRATDSTSAQQAAGPAGGHRQRRDRRADADRHRSPGEETVTVYYLLDIVNNSPAPVNPATPFDFEMPAGATGTAILQGSSPLATRQRSAGDRQRSVSAGQHARAGRRRRSTGPRARSNITQRFPAPLDRLRRDREESRRHEAAPRRSSPSNAKWPRRARRSSPPPARRWQRASRSTCR